jgi:hypothetical protein
MEEVAWDLDGVAVVPWRDFLARLTTWLSSESAG